MMEKPFLLLLSIGAALLLLAGVFRVIAIPAWGCFLLFVAALLLIREAER